MKPAAAPPATRYVESGGVNIAYQVVGDGPKDVVFIPSFVSNLELAWDWPQLAAFYSAFTSFARLILFDKRGTGLSDRVKELPDTEKRMDDVRAVMDATNSERAAIVGLSEGAALALVFASRFPNRVSELVVYAPLPKATRTADYPWAEPAEWWNEVVRRFRHSWGSPEYMDADVAWRAPSETGNRAFVEWWGQYRRLGASPGAAADLAEMNATIDVRALLPQIQVPTTVIVRAGDRVVEPAHGRYVAEHVPGARYVELPGDDHLPFVGDTSALVTEIARAVGVEREIVVDSSRFTALHASVVDRKAAALLSDRELDVMRWVARGKTNRDIATALYVSESTVRKHLQNAYRKLGVTNRTTALAILNGSLHEE